MFVKKECVQWPGIGKKNSTPKPLRDFFRVFLFIGGFNLFVLESNEESKTLFRGLSEPPVAIQWRARNFLVIRCWAQSPLLCFLCELHIHHSSFFVSGWFYISALYPHNRLNPVVWFEDSELYGSVLRHERKWNTFFKSSIRLRTVAIHSLVW